MTTSTTKPHSNERVLVSVAHDGDFLDVAWGSLVLIEVLEGYSSWLVHLDDLDFNPDLMRKPGTSILIERIDTADLSLTVATSYSLHHDVDLVVMTPASERTIFVLACNVRTEDGV